MKFSIILIFVGALFATTAKAGVFTTSPYAKITWQGGSTVRITWRDDNTTPLIKDLQSLTVDLYFGNNTSQTFVTNIGTNIQGTAQSLTYTVPKNVGPPGEYFIKFSEGNYQQTSGIFHINGVNGNTPTAAPSTALYAAPSASVSGYNPYNSYSGATPTNAITTPTASGTSKSSSSTTPSKTPPALSNGSDINRMVYTNYLTLSSLVLSTILLKYLL